MLRVFNGMRGVLLTLLPWLPLFICGAMLSVQAATKLHVELLPDRRVTVRWSATEGEWRLQGVDTLAGLPPPWLDLDIPQDVQGADRSITLTPTTTTRFFRLREATPAGSLTSVELIEKAIADGVITDETGLIYKVYVLFNDSRLPVAYRGNDAGANASGALEDMVDRWATLSEQARIALKPFLTPPAYRGSWGSPVPVAQKSISAAERPELDPDWAAFPVSGGHVKVWYKFSEPLAREMAILCANALNNEIWPKLIGLGMFEPLSDFETAEFDGGDGRLDVYLSDFKAPGLTATHYGAASAVSIARKHHPVYLLINKTKPLKDIVGTLAHEFMHASQWAYPVNALGLSSYQWLKESTAQWAVDYVYPTNQLEHVFAPYYFDEPEVSLDVFDDKDTKKGNHGYGSYLFFQYLSRSSAGGAAMIKNTWASTIGKSDQLDALNSCIPGGFKQQWPEFAKTLWNQDPIDSKPNSFTLWDDMLEYPKARTEPGDLPSGQSEDTITLDDELANLSSRYYHWTFSGSETRSLMFHNTFFNNFKNQEPVSVQAMWRTVDGAWTEENWTDLEWIGFCRDQKDQRLEHLVVIISSAKWQAPGNPIEASETPVFMRNNIGCWGYQGTASRLTLNPNGGVGHTTVSATVRFGFQPSGQTGRADGRLRAFLTAPMFHDGALQFTERYTEGDCTYSASSASPMTSFLTGGESASSIYMNNFPQALPESLRAEAATLIGPDQGAYIGDGLTIRTIHGQVTGENCGSTYVTFPGLWWMTTDAAYEDGGVIPKVRPNGHLQGTFRDSGDGSIFTWDLAPLPEP